MTPVPRGKSASDPALTPSFLKKFCGKIPLYHSGEGAYCLLIQPQAKFTLTTQFAITGTNGKTTTSELALMIRGFQERRRAFRVRIAPGGGRARSRSDEFAATWPERQRQEHPPQPQHRRSGLQNPRPCALHRIRRLNLANDATCGTCRHLRPPTTQHRRASNEGAACGLGGREPSSSITFSCQSNHDATSQNY